MLRGSNKNLKPLRGSGKDLKLLRSSVKAGLVKWYNNGFPNRGQEFDSPIPHKNNEPNTMYLAIIFL